MTPSQSRGPTEDRVLGERIFRQRWTGRGRTGDDSLWRSAGFEVLDDRVGGDLPVSAELVRPVLRWLGQPAASAREVGSAGSVGVPERPVLRWAIKTSIPADDRGQSWGDLFFA